MSATAARPADFDAAAGLAEADLADAAADLAEADVADAAADLADADAGLAETDLAETDLAVPARPAVAFTTGATSRTFPVTGLTELPLVELRAADTGLAATAARAATSPRLVPPATFGAGFGAPALVAGTFFAAVAFTPADPGVAVFFAWVAFAATVLKPPTVLEPPATLEPPDTLEPATVFEPATALDPLPTPVPAEARSADRGAGAPARDLPGLTTVAGPASREAAAAVRAPGTITRALPAATPVFPTPAVFGEPAALAEADVAATGFDTADFDTADFETADFDTAAFDTAAFDAAGFTLTAFAGPAIAATGTTLLGLAAVTFPAARTPPGFVSDCLPEIRAVTPAGTFALAATATPLPVFAAARRPTAADFDAGTRPVTLLLPPAAPAAVTDFAVLLRVTALAPLDPATVPGAPAVARFAVPGIGCGSAPGAAGLIGAFLAAGIGVFPPCE